MDASVPCPLTSCWIFSELELPFHCTVLGLASGRTRIILSLCIPFLFLVFEVLSGLVWRAEDQSHTDSSSLGYTLFPLPAMPLKEAEMFSYTFQSSLSQIQCCCWQFQDSSEGLAGAAGLLPAVLYPRHGTSPFIQGTAARLERSSREKQLVIPQSTELKLQISHTDTFLWLFWNFQGS